MHAAARPRHAPPVRHPSPTRSLGPNALTCSRQAWQDSLTRSTCPESWPSSVAAFTPPWLPPRQTLPCPSRLACPRSPCRLSELSFAARSFLYKGQASSLPLPLAKLRRTSSFPVAASVARGQAATAVLRTSNRHHELPLAPLMLTDLFPALLRL